MKRGICIFLMALLVPCLSYAQAIEYENDSGTITRSTTTKETINKEGLAVRAGTINIIIKELDELKKMSRSRAILIWQIIQKNPDIINSGAPFETIIQKEKDILIKEKASIEVMIDSLK